MYLLLLLVGVVLAAAGVAMMRYAVPIEEFSSVALFVSGVVAIVGALVIGALAVVARTLGRIAERLEIQPLPLPPVAAVGHEDPAPRPARPPAPGDCRGRAARPSCSGWLGAREFANTGTGAATARHADSPSLHQGRSILLR